MNVSIAQRKCVPTINNKRITAFIFGIVNMATIDTLKQIGQIGIMIICVAVVIAIWLNVWSQSLEAWYEDCDTKYGGGNWSVKEEVCGMDICYKCQYNASLSSVKHKKSV